MEGYDIPITFIVFNRPDTTVKVFEKIKQIKPQKLLIISDAARNNDEKTFVDESRKIAESVDWECTVLKNYAESNMGCGYRVSSGLDWVFENVDYSIILEDDCVPEISFFQFCREMLLKYKDDERIMYITGDNFHKDVVFDASYDFAKIGWIWGWATWRRAWKKYDFKVPSWASVKEKNLLEGYYTKKENKFFANDIESLFTRNFHTWDFQWQYANAINSGLCVVPKVNLISNIGFDINATHTTGKMPFYDDKTEPLSFPLEDPKVIVANKKYDDLTFLRMKCGGNSWQIFVRKVKRKIRKLFGKS